MLQELRAIEEKNNLDALNNKRDYNNNILKDAQYERREAQFERKQAETIAHWQQIKSDLDKREIQNQQLFINAQKVYADALQLQRDAYNTKQLMQAEMQIQQANNIMQEVKNEKTLLEAGYRDLEAISKLLQANNQHTLAGLERKGQEMDIREHKLYVDQAVNESREFYNKASNETLNQRILHKQEQNKRDAYINKIESLQQSGKRRLSDIELKISQMKKIKNDLINERNDLDNCIHDVDIQYKRDLKQERSKQSRNNDLLGKYIDTYGIDEIKKQASKKK